MRFGANILPAPGTAEALLIARWKRRHILSTVFAPHRVLRIGLQDGKLYRFRRMLRQENDDWIEWLNWAVYGLLSSDVAIRPSISAIARFAQPVTLIAPW